MKKMSFEEALKNIKKDAPYLIVHRAYERDDGYAFEVSAKAEGTGGWCLLDFNGKLHSLDYLLAGLDAADAEKQGKLITL